MEPKEAIAVFVIGLGLALVPAPASAEIIATEDFVDADRDGELIGEEEGLGWADAWAGDATVTGIVDADLAYDTGGGIVEAASVLEVSGNNDAAVTRTFEVPLEGDFYLSFLFSLAEGEIGDNDFAVWWFNANTFLNIGIKTQEGGPPGTRDFMLRNGPSAADITTLYSETQLEVGEIYFIVMHVAKSDPGGDFDLCEVWINPMFDDDAAPEIVLDEDLKLASIAMIGMRSANVDPDDAFRFGALRIGTEWEDVVPSDTTCPGGLRAGRAGADVRLSWRSGDAPATSVRIVRNGLEVAAAAAVEPPEYIDASPPPGAYEYTLTFAVQTAVCDPLVARYDGCITHLRASRDAGGVTLAWTNNLPYAGIEIARDGRTLEILAGDATAYLDPDPPTDAPDRIVVYGVRPVNGTCGATEIEVEVYPDEDVSPWTSEDIGDTMPGGIEREADDAFRVFANGADIWNAADAFRFTYVEFEGDFEITAVVERFETADPLRVIDPWAKAGLMVRTTTDPGSPYALIHATPDLGGNGIDFQWRAAQGANAANIADGQTGPGSFLFPITLRLRRIGDVFYGAYSSDGVAWTQHQQPQTVVMDDPVLVGMAVSSHAAGTIAAAEFAEVTGPEAIEACPSDVTCTCGSGILQVTVTWTNNWDYSRIRIYRTPVGGTRQRIASIDGTLEIYTDTGIAALSVDQYLYEVVPVIGSGEHPGCAAARCGIDWPECRPIDGREFIRSDTDGNGVLTIGDGVQILERLFSNRPAFGSNCEKTGDFDDSGALTIGDAVSAFNLLFVPGSRSPGPPYPECGADPTADDLPCDGPVPACP
ncbi:MAG: hypothetical protein JXP34_25960 [Planctomycetes bacterium]|nr:hypothetical protein [Planctomycetota bacterium]